MRSGSGERGIYKRRRHDGEYWAYRFQYGGNSYSGTTDLRATQKSLPAAKRALAEHLQRVKVGTAQATEPTRFNEAVEKFIEWSQMEHREHPATAQRQLVSLTVAGRSFGNIELREITAGDIENFKLIRRKSNMAEVTIRKDLLALSQLFQFGIKQRWCAANPVKDVTLPSDRDSLNERTVDRREEALYFDEAGRQNPVLHDVGRLMLWQGLRPEEALSLTRDDVDLEGRALFVRKGKSRAARREIYIQRLALPILKRRMAGRYPHLFPGGRWRYNGQPYSYSGLINAHKDVLAALNREVGIIEPFDIYSLRHTFATRFYEDTKDLDKLARILGHANLATVRRYVNPSQADLRAAMQTHEASCNFRATQGS